MKKTFSIVLGLALLAVMLFGVGWLLQQGFHALQAMDPDTRGASIAAFSVVAVSVITFSTQLWL